MHCGECNNDLADCTCPDLQDRLKDAAKGGHFVYRKCAKCDLHYAKCKCPDPEWVVEGGEGKVKLPGEFK